MFLIELSILDNYKSLDVKDLFYVKFPNIIQTYKSTYDEISLHFVDCILDGLIILARLNEVMSILLTQRIDVNNDNQLMISKLFDNSNA